MDAAHEQAKKARRIVVKLGSTVLASLEGRGFNLPVMAGLAQQIAALRAEGREVVVVSSGAILAGAHLIDEPLPVKTIGLSQALAALGQVELMRRWTEIFSWFEIHVAQILLTRDDVAHRKRFLSSRRTMGQLLERGILPIVNENDTVTVEEIKLGDNDRLSALVTNLVTADLLVLLTEVGGLFTADPRKDPRARLIPRIDRVTPQVQALAGDGGPAGRGGMATKLEAARQTSLFGVPTVIAAGREPLVLQRIAAGEPVGTLIEPCAERLDSRQHWIAFSQAPAGKLHLDGGAAAAVASQGKSLLPSGILSVEGDFEVGDAVELVDANGSLIGRGIVSYSSSEVRQIRGLRSAEIESVLGYRSADEVVHRDDLVIEKEDWRVQS